MTNRKDFKRFCYNLDGTCEDERCNCNRVCMYDVNAEAITVCVVCGGGLCKICGYTSNGVQYCNSCYHEIVEKQEIQNAVLTII